MAYLRHTARHVQETIADMVEAHLGVLAWLGPAIDVPFGASPVQMLRRPLAESEMQSISGNLVMVTFGDEPDDLDQELGGGLVMVEHVLFVDVVAERDAIAVALAADLKDLLAARLPGSSRMVALLDHSQVTPTPVEGYMMELTNVVRERVERDWRPNWYAVKATVQLYYIGEG